MHGNQVLARLGFGAAALGTDYGLLKNTTFSGAEILDQVQRSGLRLLDTAIHYGKSQSIIGDYLRKNPKSGFSVISKFLPQNWRVEIEQAKKDLGSHLSQMLWHNYDHSSFRRDGNPSLDSIQSELKSVQLGCSTYGVENAVAAVESGFFRMVELEYNLLNPHAFTAVQKSAKSRGVILVLRSLLQKGFLTNEFQKNPRNVHPEPEKNKQILATGVQISGLAKSIGISVEELALRYAIHTTGDAIILFGANAPHQIVENVRTLTGPPLESAAIESIQEIQLALDPELCDLRTWRA